VFRYITFRSAYAAITALLVCFVFGPPLIAWLQRVKLGQKIREDGPRAHLSKAGTPTMGGLLDPVATVVPTPLWATSTARTVARAHHHGGAIGFRRLAARGEGRPRAARPPQLIGQIGPGRDRADVAAPRMPATTTHVPFLKFSLINFGWLFVLFVIFIITALERGEPDRWPDGLAGLMAIAARYRPVPRERPSQVQRVPQHHAPRVWRRTHGVLRGGAGASLGFLWYNCHPADVFMGDRLARAGRSHGRSRGAQCASSGWC
jgi:phospho-N-acetylmuramoyl-pentapeptide-transferase